jgi:pimeloyl-ACP methyl ester carboxylesterase
MGLSQADGLRRREDWVHVPGMAAWTDGYWWSHDGLRLHYRDYAGAADRPPIIGLPGLTRNARDFEKVAGWLAGEWRLICVDLRGRGESAVIASSLAE